MAWRIDICLGVDVPDALLRRQLLGHYLHPSIIHDT
jgi:hypothetical protein